ncbi:MAG: archaellin/type IV pilin N-terminal domain-containing protein [Asgard group archaeon]|nr:archaellin/type IV pilin N-terminal domain-containing protein [Asgard group archaeon]
MSLIKSIFRKKKAVSPVIATILLIALTVTAAAIVYFVVVPLFQKQPELVIESGPNHVTGQADQIQMTINNIGAGEASLDPAEFTLTFDNGTSIDINVLDNTGTEITEAITIGSQQSITLRIQIQNFDFNTGTTYNIGIPTMDIVSYTY